jgi:enoyl-CoA hydratase
MDVFLERRGGVAVLTVSDPTRRNALSLELSDRLARAVATCDDDWRSAGVLRRG